MVNIPMSDDRYNYNIMFILYILRVSDRDRNKTVETGKLNDKTLLYL